MLSYVQLQPSNCKLQKTAFNIWTWLIGQCACATLFLVYIVFNMNANYLSKTTFYYESLHTHLPYSRGNLPRNSVFQLACYPILSQHLWMCLNQKKEKTEIQPVLPKICPDIIKENNHLELLYEIGFKLDLPMNMKPWFIQSEWSLLSSFCSSGAFYTIPLLFYMYMPLFMLVICTSPPIPTFLHSYM